MLVLLGCCGPPVGMMLIVLFVMLLLGARLILAVVRALAAVFQALWPEPMVDQSRLGRGA